jgi:hypothetical protein
MPEPRKSSGLRGRISPRARRILGWLLAPLLASAAIVVQLSIDVPRAEMLERSEKKKKSKKKLRRNKRKRKRGYQPRNEGKLRRLRERWSGRPIEKEPTDQAFRRRHEALLRSVVTRVRSEVLGDAPSMPMQIRPTCHTIRCELELCGPAEVLANVAELLPEVGVGDEPLWHELREIEAKREPPKREAMRDHACRRWIGSFAVEGPPTRELKIPEFPLPEGDPPAAKPR